MRILNLSLGQDTGGQQLRLARAWRKHRPDDEYIAVTTTKTFYPIENAYNAQEVISKWWPEADVVHLNNHLARVITRFRRRIEPKPLVVHHHGTIFRTQPQLHIDEAEAYGAQMIFSTPDLLAASHAAGGTGTWVPLCYDRDELAAYRDPIDDGILRVAHAPTHRGIKSTEAVIAAVQRLQSEGVRIELDLIEKVSNVECMQRKGRADVYVDQVFLGYGCNAVEAWGMGIPVIAGVDPERLWQKVHMQIPPTTLSVMEQLWGQVPFYSATEDTIYEALRAMLDPSIRLQYSVAGTAHFALFHDSAAVVQRLDTVYRRQVLRGAGYSTGYTGDAFRRQGPKTVIRRHAQ